MIPGFPVFGLFRDTWKWADQTNFPTINWKSGKPDNAPGNDNYGYLNNTQAADSHCSDIMPFYCYFFYNEKIEKICQTSTFAQTTCTLHSQDSPTPSLQHLSIVEAQKIPQIISQSYHLTTGSNPFHYADSMHLARPPALHQQNYQWIHRI